jgi:hypothetical protein
MSLHGPENQKHGSTSEETKMYPTLNSASPSASPLYLPDDLPPPYSPTTHNQQAPCIDHQAPTTTANQNYNNNHCTINTIQQQQQAYTKQPSTCATLDTSQPSKCATLYTRQPSTCALTIAQPTRAWPHNTTEQANPRNFNPQIYAEKLPGNVENVSLCACGLGSWWKWCCLGFWCSPISHFFIAKKTKYTFPAGFLFIWFLTFIAAQLFYFRANIKLNELCENNNNNNNAVFDDCIIENLGEFKNFWLDQYILSLFIALVIFGVIYFLEQIFLRHDFSKKMKNDSDFMQSCLVHWFCTSCSIAQMGAHMDRIQQV